jgi:penicillin-binding protein 1A
MNAYLRIPLVCAAWMLAAGVATVAVFTGGYYYVEPSLGEAAELRNLEFQIPLRIYTRDGRLMGQFGEQNRTPVRYEAIPPTLIRAVLAAEDDTFFDHPGLDYTGTARAAVAFVLAGGDRVPGGSTITQQVARQNFNLSQDVSLVRKFKEWILAFRIEREFTKQEILGIYLNTNFFGYSSYGVVAAAQTYFNKSLAELTLSESAVIAGTLQRPSEWNPYYSADNARARRGYVLRRLRSLDWITPAEYESALAEPIASRRYAQQIEVEGDYVAEMVRIEMIRRFGDAAYEDGLKVTTTIDSRLQEAANRALRATLDGYDERHGYRGPLARVSLVEEGLIDPDTGEPDESLIRAYLDDYEDVLALETGLVVAIEGPAVPVPGSAGLSTDDGTDTETETEATDRRVAQVFLPRSGLVDVGLDAVEWARPYITDREVGARPGSVVDVLTPGDVVRFRRLENGGLRLAQLPDVQGAFVALDPRDGAIAALVGGYDYFLSNYNRATQAGRQPGSSFKPFAYSAAFEHGFTTASIINDAPIVEESVELETKWKPDNFDGVSHGEVRLREAFRESWNQAAIRTVRAVGIVNTITHARKFGFGEAALPRNETLAVGTGSVSPVELANAYATFANGGHRVVHHFIDRIEDADGEVLYDSSWSVAVVCEPVRVDYEGSPLNVPCSGAEEEPARPGRRAAEPELVDSASDLYPVLRRAERAISEQNAYLITDVLKDVIQLTSGRRAAVLNRSDLAGKTGTTNGPRDAWFAGFNGDIVGVAWVGFDDDSRPLGGSREQGGVTAIPMWIDFMAEALEGLPEHAMERPAGIVELRINPDNGLIASDANPRAIFEIFRVGDVPQRESDTAFTVPGSSPGESQATPNEPIF